MDARQQMALAPLVGAGLGSEAAGQDVAVLLQREQRDARLRGSLRIQRRDQRQRLGRDPQGDAVAAVALQAGGTRIGGQLGQPVRPGRVCGGLAVGQNAERDQRLEHLVAAARLRPGVLEYRCDRVRIEPSEVVGAVRTLVAAAVHGLGTALFQRRIVEERVRPRVQRSACAAQIVHQLLRSGRVQRQFPVQPGLRLRRTALLQAPLQLRAQPRHASRQFVAAPGRFAEPERDVRRRAPRVFHPHPPRLHAQDAIAGVAELEHVAAEALHREVFVDRADGFGLRFQQHAVIAGLGNGAAGGQRRHTRAAAMHRVAMQIAGARPQPGAEAVAQHPQALSQQRRVQPGAAQQRVQRVLVPFLARHLGDQLLRQHVQRRVEDAQRVQFAAAHAVEQGRAFDQVVARLRKQPRLRRAADGMPGTFGALQETGDRTRRAELAHQIHIADVQTQFQRCGGDEHLQLAGFEPLLGEQPRLARQAAVVRRHCIVAEQFADMPRGAFGHAPGVDEHQRGAMRAHQLGQARVHLLPLVVAHAHAERRRRHFQRQVAGTRIADVDDRAAPPAPQRCRPGSARSRRSASASLTGRCATAAPRIAAAAAAATAPSGCRAC